jgi:transposase
MLNKYIIRSRISEKKFREILKFFCLDLEAKKISEISGISRNSVNKIIKAIRVRIAELCEYSNPLGLGEIEIDESYFGAKRTRGKRGRGSSGKTPVFGMLKRNGKVYTQIVKNCSANELIPIIKSQADNDSTMFSDSWKSYNGLADFGYKRHYRIKHGNNEFAKRHIGSQDGKRIKIRNHINGIENFWGLAKTRLVRFRGIHKSTFKLHLKECEFRFNNRKENLYKILLAEIKKLPLKLS